MANYQGVNEINGITCESCHDKGIHFPLGDSLRRARRNLPRGWYVVERCTTCARFADDVEAAMSIRPYCIVCEMFGETYVAISPRPELPSQSEGLSFQDWLDRLGTKCKPLLEATFSCGLFIGAVAGMLLVAVPAAALFTLGMFVDAWRRFRDRSDNVAKAGTALRTAGSRIRTWWQNRRAPRDQ